MMWSKIAQTDIGHDAALLYMKGTHRYYHNWLHICDCYDYLESNNVEYDEDLDYAVLYHDIVYDDQPDKEKRSSDLLLQHFPGKDRAAEIIMATAGHDIRNRSWQEVEMIKADLHQLADPCLVLSNFQSIMLESMEIYKCSAYEFAKSNCIFMNKLRNTIYCNLEVEKSNFWNDVSLGTMMTVEIADSMCWMYSSIGEKNDS